MDINTLEAVFTHYRIHLYSPSVILNAAYRLNYCIGGSAVVLSDRAVPGHNSPEPVMDKKKQLIDGKQVFQILKKTKNQCRE